MTVSSSCRRSYIRTSAGWWRSNMSSCLQIFLFPSADVSFISSCWVAGHFNFFMSLLHLVLKCILADQSPVGQVLTQSGVYTRTLSFYKTFFILLNFISRNTLILMEIKDNPNTVTIPALFVAMHKCLFFSCIFKL